MPRANKRHRPFRYFNSSPEIIRLVVMMYVRFPLSLRNVEDHRQFKMRATVHPAPIDQHARDKCRKN